MPVPFLLIAPDYIPFIVVGGVLLFTVICVAVMYNRLVHFRQLCDESFSDIDTELQRRHDLIPNLVSIVKGYAKHEKELFEKVAEVRGRAVEAMKQLSRGEAGGPTQRAVIMEERTLSGLMGNLMVVAEQYPDLKADQNFRQLMTELRNTEDRIQAARRFFNANVRELNNSCQQFPSTVVAKIFKFQKREFFEIDNPMARANVNVNFGAGGQQV